MINADFILLMDFQVLKILLCASSSYLVFRRQDTRRHTHRWKLSLIFPTRRLIDYTSLRLNFDKGQWYALDKQTCRKEIDQLNKKYSNYELLLHITSRMYSIKFYSEMREKLFKSLDSLLTDMKLTIWVIKINSKTLD